MLCSLHVFAFKGQNMKFTMNILLTVLAFEFYMYIETPGSAIIRELKQEDFSRRRRGKIREGPGLTSSFSSQI